jgi:hypothetical protein
MAWDVDIISYYSLEDDSTNRQNRQSINRIEILQYCIGFYDLDRDSTWILPSWDS